MRTLFLSLMVASFFGLGGVDVGIKIGRLE